MFSAIVRSSRPARLSSQQVCIHLRGRALTTCTALSKQLNLPPSQEEVPRVGGIATMMRLPYVKSAKGLDACFVGIPFDAGASNKVGTRFGPRHIRCESAPKMYNPATGAAPFETLMVADIGDICVNTYSIQKSVDLIHAKMSEVVADGCRPLVLGGDHTITYPVLRALKEKYGPVGLVHIDAHSDTSPSGAYDESVFHGSPFSRAVDEGLLDCERVIQIGLRGAAYAAGYYDDARDMGFRVVSAEECWHKSLEPLMAEVRQQMGSGPVYISFDIDGLDPSFAPGTGTPEIGGLTSMQGLEIVRGCKGLNVVGGDLVEVSPPYDTTGITAVTGAYLLFEMLCVLPGVNYHDYSEHKRYGK